MIKRYANLALAYAVIAMIFGVFYREFTKFSHYAGQTSLSVMHTHYFLLRMFFFLALMHHHGCRKDLQAKNNFSAKSKKKAGKP